METVQTILSNTPWWVYLLFFYLIFIGIKASKTNVVSIIKLCIIPIIFTYMSIHTLLTAFQVSGLTVSIWAVTMLVGIIFGFLQIVRLTLRVDRKKLLIEVPGTWFTLIIILVIFASKYYFGYALGVDPKLAQNTWFELSLLSISGICTGLFIGRVICYGYRLLTKPSVELAET